MWKLTVTGSVTRLIPPAMSPPIIPSLTMRLSGLKAGRAGEAAAKAMRPARTRNFILEHSSGPTRPWLEPRDCAGGWMQWYLYILAHFCAADRTPSNDVSYAFPKFSSCRLQPCTITFVYIVARFSTQIKIPYIHSTLARKPFIEGPIYIWEAILQCPPKSTCGLLPINCTRHERFPASCSSDVVLGLKIGKNRHLFTLFWITLPFCTYMFGDMCLKNADCGVFLRKMHIFSRDTKQFCFRDCSPLVFTVCDGKTYISHVSERLFAGM